MGQAEAQRSRACDLLRHRQLLRLRDLRTAGISAETMARLGREGVVIRPARGLYQLADSVPDARHSLAEASALAPKAVVCLTSALQFHELTLQMPSVIWMAIERTGWKPKVDYPLLRFVRFSGRALTDGVERHRIEGVEVPVFDPAKTVVDCFATATRSGWTLLWKGCAKAFAGGVSRLISFGLTPTPAGSGR